MELSDRWGKWGVQAVMAHSVVAGKSIPAAEGRSMVNPQAQR
jgi:hypothetical protein